PTCDHGDLTRRCPIIQDINVNLQDFFTRYGLAFSDCLTPRQRLKMIKIDNISLPDFPLLLAPMEDVSDPPFRAVCKDNGADLMYSEFISSEGLIRDAIKSRQKLDFSEEERRLGIQIFGGEEDAMAMSARMCETGNPD